MSFIFHAAEGCFMDDDKKKIFLEKAKKEKLLPQDYEYDITYCSYHYIDNDEYLEQIIRYTKLMNFYTLQY